MKEWQGKRYWLVGGSDGLGRALAEQLSTVGVELILSGRDEEKLRRTVDELPGRARAVRCDVADTASVSAAAREVGEVDGMVYLAGVYWPMTVMEWDAQRAEETLNVNLVGCLRVLGEVVPKMVQRDRGHIVLIGSLSGYRGLPASLAYGASKAGVMHLAESLRSGLRETGVEVQLANPGFVRTRLTQRNEFDMPFMMEPKDAARLVFEHMNNNSFSRTFPLLYGSLFRIGQFLPDWLYYRIYR
ncbi:SDR family NAD(P)-dependent oxidoreductase [Roseitranquillus sediminis]|uniref:SDR family NAD(P)-dependent oxidoreductase n=1 Tax=Roseitranquillus sediminis TaxID=2809051 RepID=UPI001D0C90CD|nr:SDR family NAD(P)-dependent oxidoreductase [Roseitranquillus sediminis]MBM9593663.1 SDR family NAD(P)-dependent oxidoreductase [Roseitranquillus sediminis]